MELDVCLTRTGEEPWGFRLIGGIDFDMPLTVVKVVPNSPAEYAGLRNGDTVSRIGGADSTAMSHDDSRDALAKAQDCLELTVVRGLYDPVLDDTEIIYETDQPDFDQPSQPTEVDYLELKLPEFTQQPLPDLLENQLSNLLESNADRSLTTSPFVAPTKPYRPFSTEPINEIPPIEDPIILNPYYHDEFDRLLNLDEDYLPATRFKLPISEQYDPDGTKKLKLQKDGGKKTTEASFETTTEKVQKDKQLKQDSIKEKTVKETTEMTEVMTKEEVTFLETMKNEIDIEKIELTATSIVDESIEKALIVAEEIKKEIDVELRESSVDKKSMKSETIESTQFDSKEAKELVELIDKTTEEVIKHNGSFVDSETTHINKLESTDFESESIESKLSSEDIKHKSIESVKMKTSAMEENIEESEMTASKIQTNQKDVQKRIEASEITEEEKSTKTQFESVSNESRTDKKYSTSKLLSEQRAYTIGLQTIPNIRGTVHSSYHYDLLLKTFFIHLTDVMVALSRFILAEPVLSKEPQTQETKKDVTTTVHETVSGDKRETTGVATKAEKKEKVKFALVKEAKRIDQEEKAREKILVDKNKEEQKVEGEQIIREQRRIEQQEVEKELREVKQEAIIKLDEQQVIKGLKADTEYIEEVGTNELIERKLRSGSEMAQLTEKKSTELMNKMGALITEFETKAGVEEVESTRERRSRSRSRTLVTPDISALGKTYTEATETTTSSEISSKISESTTKSKYQTADYTCAEGAKTYVAIVEAHMYTNKDAIFDEQRRMSESVSKQRTQEACVSSQAIQGISTEKESTDKIEKKVTEKVRAAEKTVEKAKEIIEDVKDINQKQVTAEKQMSEKDVTLIDKLKQIKHVELIHEVNKVKAKAIATVEEAKTEAVTIEKTAVQESKICQKAAAVEEVRVSKAAEKVLDVKESVAVKEVVTESKVKEEKQEVVPMRSGRRLPFVSSVKQSQKIEKESVAAAQSMSIQKEEIKESSSVIESVLHADIKEVAIQEKTEKVTMRCGRRAPFVPSVKKSPAVSQVETIEKEQVKESSAVIKETVAKEEIKETVAEEKVVSIRSGRRVPFVPAVKKVQKTEESSAVIKETVAKEEIKETVAEKKVVSIRSGRRVPFVPSTKKVQKPEESAALKITKEQLIEQEKTVVDVKEEENVSVKTVEIAQIDAKETFESKHIEQESTFVAKSVESYNIDQESNFVAKSVETKHVEQESTFVATSTASQETILKEKLTLNTDIPIKKVEPQISEESDIKTPTPTSVPPTPLTDEYIFKLEIPLPKRDGLPEIPRDCTPSDSEDEDPHIVKKGLVPHIEAEVAEPVKFDPPLPTPPVTPGSPPTSPKIPVYTKPGLRGGGDRDYSKEEILEIERKSSLLASAIDETIKSIEEYKEEVGLKQEATTNGTGNGIMYNGYAKVVETKVFDSAISENKTMKESENNVDSSEFITEYTIKSNNIESEDSEAVEKTNKTKSQMIKTENIKPETVMTTESVRESITAPVVSNSEAVSSCNGVAGIKEEKQEVEEVHRDPMEGYKPVHFDPEELLNAQRERRARLGVQAPQLTASQERELYKTQDGKLIGTHQGIVDGLEESTVDAEVAKELGKPGITEEKIAELISGEAEMLREAHVMGLSRVLASHMHRADDDSSVDFKKIKPIVESLKDSEVLKALNEEMMKAYEEKKKEERKWTTFLQKPKRPVPKGKFGNWEQEEEKAEPYKVKIVKQPKPKVAPDYKPKDFNTGLLPWEERALREPTPPPVDAEDPILIPEEAPEILEAVDPLPESEVPDLEDSGIPLPPPKLEDSTPPPEQETNEEEELDLEAVVEETEKIVEENLSEEMEKANLAEQLISSVQNMVDPNAPLDQQLAQMRAQLAALAQLPGVIQQSLELVTKQLSQLSQLEQTQTMQITEEISQKETETEAIPDTETVTQNGVSEDEKRTEEPMIEEPVEVKPTITPEEIERMKREEEEMLEEQRRMEKQKKEAMEQARIEHESRQVKQRSTPRVGKPKPVFGPPAPVERPVVLPGGRKWRKPEDAYNEQLYAEALAAQAELIAGKTKGLSYESVLLPYDERINFMKYEKPPVSLDHLKDSDVYKMIHGMEMEQPCKRVEMRTPVIAEVDYREKCRSMTPCPERLAQQVQP